MRKYLCIAPVVIVAAWLTMFSTPDSDLPTKSEIRKAMNHYREAHPRCELTGAPKVEVHHILSQKYYPELAADTNNMISLCRLAHGWVGHGIYNGGAWTKYNPNVRETVDAMRIAYQTTLVLTNARLDVAANETQ
jgi:hypothetical protein